MKLLELNEESRRTVFLKTESGMDFAIVTGLWGPIAVNSTFVVRGNGLAIPIERLVEDVYSLVDMFEGRILPTERQVIALTEIAAVSVLTSASLPPGYLPARGAY